MVIRLKSTGKIISKDAKFLNTLEKTKGLILQKNPKTVIFKTRFGIHTFLMKQPIDVIILDNNFKIQYLKTVKPNQIFLWNPKFNWVIEFPHSSITKFKLKKGDVLTIN